MSDLLNYLRSSILISSQKQHIQRGLESCESHSQLEATLYWVGIANGYPITPI